MSGSVQVAVVGAGYVGATTAACLADIGHQVRVYDIDVPKLDLIASGRAPVFEAGLDEVIARTIESGALTVTSDPAVAVAGARFVLLCVPTPAAADGSADTSSLEAASSTLAPLLEPGAVVINKSTVPVGSTKIVAEQLGRDDVTVASNPEFLREGTALHDFMHPDRVVIGCNDLVVAEQVADLYRPLGDVEFVLTDPASAELIKYASNAYLATRLSFVNAVAEVAEALGGDMVEVARGIGLDTRIGPQFLRPGPGWGGSCFPKDTRALVRMADKAGFEFRFLNAVISANDQQFDLMASRALEMVADAPSPARVAALGLAFKAGTDDVRNSPAVEVVERLLAAGVEVVAHDPQASGAGVEGLVQADSAMAAADGADLLLLLTEWPEYSSLDPSALRDVMRTPALQDTRNIVDGEAYAKAGFRVRQIGRGEVTDRSV